MLRKHIEKSLKVAILKIKINGKTVTIAGTAKGAGMIGPNMATTISLFTTDAAISKPLLSKALKAAIANSLMKVICKNNKGRNNYKSKGSLIYYIHIHELLTSFFKP